MRFGYVPPPFDGLWPDITRLLDKAVQKGGNRWCDVKHALAVETAQLWLTMDDNYDNCDRSAASAAEPRQPRQVIEKQCRTLQSQVRHKCDKPINATVSRMDGKTVEIWLCGGSVLAGSLHYLETILSAARDAGATDARILGRKGWQRALRGYGWQISGDELVKGLT